MSVTVEMFLALYSFCGIMPQFLSLVLGLGTKLASKDEDFMATYSRNPGKAFVGVSAEHQETDPDSAGTYSPMPIASAATNSLRLSNFM